MEKKSEDLSIKIGSKEMVEWTGVKEAQEKSLRNSKINIEIAEVVLKLVNRRLEEEKEKFKKKEN